MKQETVSGSGISWAICKSAHCSRQITTPAPHHSVFYRPDALPATQPTVSKHQLKECVATLPWEIQKSPVSTLLFIHFRLFTLPQKKTNSNCCTAALAVYLQLLSANYYLHSPSTASGARWRRSACVDMDMLRFVAAACCDMG